MATYMKQLADVQKQGRNIKGKYVPANENQTIGLFWDEDSNDSVHGKTSNIGGIWLTIAKSVLPGSMTMRKQAQFYAQASAAMHDASITCFKVK